MLGVLQGVAGQQAFGWAPAVVFVGLAFVLAVLAGQVHDAQQQVAHHKRQLEQLQQELAQRQSELLHRAEHDPLTGLYNRRGFSEKLEHEYAWAVRCETPFSVALFDIDAFQAITDQHPHPAGDQVLREVARLLAHTVRELDVVARHSGEAFVAFFPCTNTRQALIVAERFRASVEEHSWASVAPGLRVTVSGGVCGDASLGDPHKMLEAADGLLQQAKKSGRNRIEYFQEPNLN